MPRSLLEIFVVEQGQISLVNLFSEVGMPQAGVAEHSHRMLLAVYKDAGAGGAIQETRQGKMVLGQWQESNPRVLMWNEVDMAMQHQEGFNSQE